MPVPQHMSDLHCLHRKQLRIWQVLGALPPFRSNIFVAVMARFSTTSYCHYMQWAAQEKKSPLLNWCNLFYCWQVCSDLNCEVLVQMHSMIAAVLHILLTITLMPAQGNCFLAGSQLMRITEHGHQLWDSCWEEGRKYRTRRKGGFWAMCSGRKPAAIVSDNWVVNKVASIFGLCYRFDIIIWAMSTIAQEKKTEPSNRNGPSQIIYPYNNL